MPGAGLEGGCGCGGIFSALTSLQTSSYRKEDHQQAEKAELKPSGESTDSEKQGHHKLASDLKTFRSKTMTQKGANVCLTFLGSFFGVALIATMSRSAPFKHRSAPIVVGR